MRWQGQSGGIGTRLTFPANRDDVENTAIVPRRFGTQLAAMLVGALYYLFSLTGGGSAAANEKRFQLVTPFGHTQLIQAAAMSEDGAWLFTAGNDGTVVFWNMHTGKSVARLKIPRGKIGSLSTNQNGSLVVVSADEIEGQRYRSRAYVYSSDTFTEVGRLEYPDGTILSTAISADGNKLATAEDPFRVVMTDLRTKKSRVADLEGRPGDLRFVDQEQSLVVSVEGAGVQVRSAQDLTVILRQKLLNQHQAPVTIYDTKSERTYIFDLGARPPTVRPYSSNLTGAVGDSLPIPSVSPRSIAAAPDGSSLAFGSFFGRIDILDRGTTRPRVSFDGGVTEFGSKSVKLLSFLDPRQLLTVLEDGTVATRAVATGKLLQTLNPTTEFTRPLETHLMGNGTHLVSVIRTHDTDKNVLRISVTNLATWRVRVIEGYAVLPLPGDQSFLAVSAGSDEKVRVQEYRLDSDTPVANRELASERVEQAALSPTGDKLLLADIYGHIKLYETSSGSLLATYQVLSDDTYCLKFVPGNRFLVCGGYGPALYSIESETPLWNVPDQFARDGLYAPECDCLVMAGHGSIYELGLDGVVRRSLATVEDALVQPSGQAIYSIVRAPSGQLLASAADGRLISLVPNAGGYTTAELSSQEGEPIRRLSVSPGDKFIIGIGQGLTLFRADDFSTLAKLYEVAGGRWALVASDGRFDTNDFSMLTDFVWSFPEQRRSPLAVELLAQPLFTPNLLLALTSDHNGPEAAIDSLSSEPLGLEIEARLENRQTAVVTVKLDSQTSSMTQSNARDLKILMNGTVVAGAEDPQWTADGSLTFPIRLPTRKAGETIEFVAYVFNADKVKSRDARTKLVLTQDVGPGNVRRIWVVAAGVGDNGPADYALSYPPRVTREISKQLGTLFGGSRGEVVSITLISEAAKYSGKNSNTSALLPTRKNLLGVLNALAGGGVPPKDIEGWPVDALGKPATVSPDDILVFYYMGHSTVEGGQLSMVTYAKGDEAEYLSEVDLAKALRDIHPLTMILLLDTCYSGAVAQNEGFKPGPFSLPGLSQLIYDKSIIVAVAANAREKAQSAGDTPFAAALRKEATRIGTLRTVSLGDYLDAVEDEGSRIAMRRSGDVAANHPRFLRLDLGIIRKAQALTINIH